MVTVGESFADATSRAIRRAGYVSQADGDSRVWCQDPDSGLRYAVEAYRSPKGKTFFRVLNIHGEAEGGRYTNPQVAVLKAAEFLRFHLAFLGQLNRGRRFDRALAAAA